VRSLTSLTNQPFRSKCPRSDVDITHPTESNLQKKKTLYLHPPFSLISDYILAMSIECWCLPVLFRGVCQINHGMVLLCSLQRVLLRVWSVLSLVFASGLFKKSGEKRKILDGLINISIHSFRLLCFFIFLNPLSFWVLLIIS